MGVVEVCFLLWLLFFVCLGGCGRGGCGGGCGGIGLGICGVFLITDGIYLYVEE